MTVQRILKSKATDDVITITPEVSVADAAGVLSNKRIGSLVVTADGKIPLGILSERDIVRELGKRGPTCMNDKVEDMMTKKVQTCEKSERADDVLARMTEGRFRHMPVMENGEMVGLITLGDVVKARLSELSMEKEALTGMIMGN
ncbi:CBS domain-containing protein [Cognatishimia sp. MH4019]|uniref:CBS domain-containing protein n=1 Tax=Cognatishimia sp. MH4019 TaxID=2854030 RepID=UPI001CD6B632|nr:CBS domain-containing protein [Cognatishimia sp. MH4019]